MDANGNEKKGHVNIYGSDPKEPHDESIHINIDYEKGSFTINEKSNGEKSSTDCNCYLTTACMVHMSDNFDDNCYELKILRWFRDNYVSKEDIRHYYEIAPSIVEQINAISNSETIYHWIYENVIFKCITAINNGDYDFAYNRYKNSVLILEEEFLKSKLKENFSKTLIPNTSN